MTQEVLKQALEALEASIAITMPKIALRNKAILALQEALAQPQQEPVAWMYPDDYKRMQTSETFCTVYSVEVGSPTRGESTVALYTSPPQRQWVALTDEERDDWLDNYIIAEGRARAIEAQQETEK